MKKSTVLIVGFLLTASSLSEAVSLGRYRGAAVIGRPLDLSVQAVLESAQETPLSCVEADVFYADNKIEKSRIRITAEKFSVGNPEALIRIQVATPIDEPVVTLVVRVGCLQKVEKRFVVLADMLSEPAVVPFATKPAGIYDAGDPTQRAMRSSSSAESTREQLTKAQKRRAATKAPGKSTAVDKGIESANAMPIPLPLPLPSSVVDPKIPDLVAAKPAVQPSKVKPVNIAKSSTKTIAKTNQSARADASGSKLTLEPLDLSIEREPKLKASMEMLSTPSGNDQQRSAAAALWRAISAPPEDMLRDLDKLQALETTVKNLQAQGQKNQVALEALTIEIKKAQSEKYANWLVLTLGLLLVAALAGLLFALRRQGASIDHPDADKTPWWKRKKLTEHKWSDSLMGGEKNFGPDSPAHFTGATKSLKSKQDSVEIDVSSKVAELAIKTSRARVIKSVPLAPLPSTFRSDFALSMSHPSRAVKAEELFDVQQQADFFVSLGQHEQAIEVLRSHIGDNEHTSALVCLDLFALYHQLERREAYEALRKEFNKSFNAKIPGFDLYHVASRGLESYPGAMSRIEALWPRHKVLGIIEEFLFRRVEVDTQAFDIEAYRELLLLYAIAKDICGEPIEELPSTQNFDSVEAVDTDRPEPVAYGATSTQPLSASIGERLWKNSGNAINKIVPLPSPRFGLDLDLSEPLVSVFQATNVDKSAFEAGTEFTIDFDAGVPFDQSSDAAADALLKRAGSVENNLIDFDLMEAKPDSIKIKAAP